MTRILKGNLRGCLLALALALVLGGCSSSALAPHSDAGDSGQTDAGLACTAGAAATDAAPFVDAACGCPAGTVCVGEIGGVAGGGGSYCSPIPEACHGVPSCACMETCACAHFSLPNRACYDGPGGQIQCDNLVR